LYICSGSPSVHIKIDRSIRFATRAVFNEQREFMRPFGKRASWKNAQLEYLVQAGATDFSGHPEHFQFDDVGVFHDHGSADELRRGIFSRK
jgi:hypothetical protein